MGIFWSSQAEVQSFNGYGEALKHFARLCSPCYLKGKLKTIQNTLLSLGYPGNLVSKVITKARNLKALKIISPQKYPVYLKLPYLVNISERFSKNLFFNFS